MKTKPTSKERVLKAWAVVKKKNGKISVDYWLHTQMNIFPSKSDAQNNHYPLEEKVVPVKIIFQV